MNQPNHKTEEESKAVCLECGLKFTTWISESKKCPECEGQMAFFDYLPKEVSVDEEKCACDFSREGHGKYICQKHYNEKKIRADLLAELKEKVEGEKIPPEGTRRKIIRSYESYNEALDTVLKLIEETK